MTPTLKASLRTTTLLSILLSSNLVAQDTGDKLTIEIGTLSTDVDTVLRVDSASGNVGTSIDLEEDLGFEPGKQINRFDLHYRFTDKHSLKYSFFQLNRSARHEIDETIVVGDTEYLIQANITAGFDYTVHSVSYGYSLRADKESNLDLLLGVYYLNTDFSIAEDSLGNSNAVNGAGPLPLIGLNYEKNLSGNWNLGARATIFTLDTGEYSGSVFDTRIRVDYQFTDRFALGLAYNWQRLNLGVEDTQVNGDFDMTMQGAELSAIFRF